MAQIPKKSRKALDQKIRRMSPTLGRLSRFTDAVKPFWGGCTNASRMNSTDYHKLALVVAIALVEDREIVPDGRKRNKIIRGLLCKLQLRLLLKKKTQPPIGHLGTQGGNKNRKRNPQRTTTSTHLCH